MLLLKIINTRGWRILSLGLMIALLNGCGGAPAVEPPIDEPPSDEPIGSADCRAPNHLALTDIESVVDWINTLPKPLTLPCFIESLPRPLAVNMAESDFSAQPSDGPVNPRVFIFIDRLIMSVVPQEKLDPKAAPVNLLELSFQSQGIKSIKAEIAFPITTALTYADAYNRLTSEFNVSVCGICHADEVQVNTIDGQPVYESVMLRPYDGTEVSLYLISNEAVRCNSTLQAHRCAMLNAIVGNGDIFWRAFATDIPVL